MKEILGLLALVALVSSLPLNSQWDSIWDEWKTKHGKEYGEMDEVPKRRIWEENMRMIDQHNLEAARGQHSYTLGMNQFGDMTHQDFTAWLSAGSVKQKRRDMLGVSDWKKDMTEKAPWHWDWRKKGYVTPVKNQGDCGSCYTFAAVGTLEGQWFKKTGILLPLSEQELVDCSGEYQPEGAGGCEGGNTDVSLSYIKDHGILSEREYPYTAVEGECRVGNAVKDAWCKGFEMGPPEDEEAMKNLLYSVGPLSVYLNASEPSFMFYGGGVVYEPEASRESNHAVLAVGYGVKSDWAKHDYWIVKNSWGTNWGNDGYILVARGNNQFGIAEFPIYPKM